ncbi:hypothetical protein F8M41_014167 [Gigaspora margarita]|uniref:Uncharacterized protein n=1 Tax=Gigaspora margarita TaxID=4874 RepID=A0A8H3WW62_GIGMA|nr:hypothetical protein F8M41_014167 [Gigaspora margarita]
MQIFVITVEQQLKEDHQVSNNIIIKILAHKKYNNEELIQNLVEKEKYKDLDKRFEQQIKTHNIIHGNIIHKAKNKQIKEQSSRSEKGVAERTSKTLKTKFDILESLNIVAISLFGKFKNNLNLDLDTKCYIGDFQGSYKKQAKNDNFVAYSLDIFTNKTYNQKQNSNDSHSTSTNEFLDNNSNAIIPSIAIKAKNLQFDIFPINAKTKIIQDKLLRLESGPKAVDIDQTKFIVEVYDINNENFKYIGYIVLKINKKEFLEVNII